MKIMGKEESFWYKNNSLNINEIIKLYFIEFKRKFKCINL